MPCKSRQGIAYPVCTEHIPSRILSVRPKHLRTRRGYRGTLPLTTSRWKCYRDLSPGNPPSGRISAQQNISVGIVYVTPDKFNFASPSSDLIRYTVRPKWCTIYIVLRLSLPRDVMYVSFQPPLQPSFCRLPSIRHSLQSLLLRTHSSRTQCKGLSHVVEHDKH